MTTDRVKTETINNTSDFQLPLRLAKKIEGKGIADVFSQDSLEKPVPIQKVANEQIETPSTWDKITSWWDNVVNYVSSWFMPKVETQVEGQISGADLISRNRPVSRVPVIDEPEVEQVTDAKRNKRKTVNKVMDATPADEMQSFEQLVMSLIKSRMALNEESGLVSTEAHKRYLELLKSSKEKLEKLKDQIDTDEKFAKYFSNGQVALGFATLALGVMSLLTPVPFGISVMGALGSAGLTVGKSYFNQRKNEDNALSTQRTFDHEKFGEALKDRRDEMGDAVENYFDCQQRLIEMAKFKRQLLALVSQK